MQIEAGEDAASVRDRLAFLPRQNVLLIWPEEGTALTRKLDLVLIQREAMRRAIRLAFVTHDPQVIEHARELNISTFETIGASQRGRWKRGRGKVFANRAQKPRGEPEPEDLMPVASRVRAPVRLPLPVIVRLTLVLLVLAAVGAVIYVAVPSATVTLTLAREVVSAESVITASAGVTAVDVENGVIPARIQPVEVREGGTRETTGMQGVPDTFASGTVVFVNLSNEAIMIPVGTVVRTTAGDSVRFLTVEDATLPAGEGQQVEVAIEAAAGSSGSVGNVGVGRINAVDASWADRVTVSNLLPTGGGESRTLPAVTESDLDILRRAVRQQVFTRALAELETYLAPSEFVIEETLVINETRQDWLTFSAGVGDFAESVTLDMRAIVEALIVDQRQGERVAFANLGQAIRGRAIDPASIEYSRGPVTAISDAGDVTFSITASAVVSPQINTDELRERLAGLSVAEAVALLESRVDLAPGVAPQITVESPWGGDRLPLLAARISIRFDQGGAP